MTHLRVNGSVSPASPSTLRYPSNPFKRMLLQQIFLLMVISSLTTSRDPSKYDVATSPIYYHKRVFYKNARNQSRSDDSETVPKQPQPSKTTPSSRRSRFPEKSKSDDDGSKAPNSRDTDYYSYEVYQPKPTNPYSIPASNPPVYVSNQLSSSYQQQQSKPYETADPYNPPSSNTYSQQQPSHSVAPYQQPQPTYSPPPPPSYSPPEKPPVYAQPVYQAPPAPQYPESQPAYQQATYPPAPTYPPHAAQPQPSHQQQPYAYYLIPAYSQGSYPHAPTYSQPAQHQAYQPAYSPAPVSQAYGGPAPTAAHGPGPIYYYESGQSHQTHYPGCQHYPTY